METSQVLHVPGKKIAYMSMEKHLQTHPFILLWKTNIRFLQVGRNHGPCFLKGRLALCMAYDSGLISLPCELRRFII